MEEEPQEGGTESEGATSSLQIVRELTHVGESKRMDKYAEEGDESTGDGGIFGTVYMKKGIFGDTAPEKVYITVRPVE